MIRIFFYTASFLFAFLPLVSCVEKQNENCNNPDAVNYDPDGAIEKNCVFPSEKIKGAWGMRLDEYPLQSTHEGETYSFDIRDAQCSGPEASYKYVQFYSLDSPFDPGDFCLLLNGFNFENLPQNKLFCYTFISNCECTFFSKQYN